jgi:uncharacterized protein YodC (DUF2158 family)
MKTGDVVRLKSGGHPMTILQADGEEAECVWSAAGDVKLRVFPVAALVIIPVAVAGS